jgi:FkbM family methyltransferase
MMHATTLRTTPLGDFILKGVNGWAILPSSLKLPDGAPRFNLEFPAEMTQDAGAQYLVSHEVMDGYEPATRNLIERTLRPGDLFIDVGAHWGLFTLQAATHPVGNIRVLAFEPDPGNAAVLFRNIVNNKLTEAAQPVCAVCGDGFDIAPLVSNSSMCHSIRGVGLPPRLYRGPSRWVPVVTLDLALGFFPHAASGRVILKIDAEGFEPKVMAGASGLLDSGRVAMIIWEFGPANLEGAERGPMLAMVDDLTRRRYRHVRPKVEEVDCPLVPFNVNDTHYGNVFSMLEG